MLRIKLQIFASFILLAVLTGCVPTTPSLTGLKYDRDKRKDYYALEQWQFDGRAAFQSASGSENPYIEWRHISDADDVRLSGPLGQGAVTIHIAEGRIEVDRGEGRTEVSDRPDELLRKQTGVFVPVRALRYWVLGLPEADRDYEAEEDGFRQAGWMVRYPEWMRVGADEMPHKIIVHNEEFKLKLVIDEWVLPHENER